MSILNNAALNQSCQPSIFAQNLQLAEDGKHQAKVADAHRFET